MYAFVTIQGARSMHKVRRPSALRMEGDAAARIQDVREELEANFSAPLMAVGSAARHRAAPSLLLAGHITVSATGVESVANLWGAQKPLSRRATSASRTVVEESARRQDAKRLLVDELHIVQATVGETDAYLKAARGLQPAALAFAGFITPQTKSRSKSLPSTHKPQSLQRKVYMNNKSHSPTSSDRLPLEPMSTCVASQSSAAGSQQARHDPRAQPAMGFTSSQRN